MELLDRPLDALMAEARTLRDAQRGRLVTYSPKVFVPLTKLCRDVCHYCTFARPPRRGERAYMSIAEVLEVARAGERAGCREALFTLGDKPELRYRAARDELAELGYSSTVEYLAAAAGAVLAETSLLPHLNPGVLDAASFDLLRPVAASMGMMLETVSERLSDRGGPHFGSPDKLPARRLETLRLAGEAKVPFTTGILIGIGETRAERLEALAAIAAAGPHVQEVIVQNFRAKPGTRMAAAPEPPLDELLWTIAAARLILPPEVAVQAPPNLTDDFAALLDAGIDDWGGVSPVTIDHVNPEAPWPELELLRRATESRGLELAPRLTVYPGHSSAEWLDAAVLPRVIRAADSLGLAREDPWSPGETREVPFVVRRDPLPLDIGGELGEDELVRLFRARGEERQRVFAAADRLRREVNGDVVTYVVTRNVQYTNVCYFRCGFCAFSKGKLAANLRGEPYLVPHAEIVRRAVEAWERGATEICLQGGIHPAFDGRLLRLGRPCDQGRRARSARARVQRARGLAGGSHARRAAAGLSDPAARRGARVAAGHGGGGARRRGPRDHLPGQDHDRAVARGARDRARARVAVEQHDHVRARRRPPQLGAPPDRRPRAAAADRGADRVRAAAVRPHGGADLPQGPGACRPDLRRGAADARGRTPRAPSLDREHPGVLGQGGPEGRRGGAPGRGERSRRHADERVDLACGRRGLGPGARSRGDGGPDPGGRPDPPAALDPVRRAAARAGQPLVRGAASSPSRGTRTSTRRSFPGRAGSCARQAEIARRTPPGGRTVHACG